MHVVDDVGVFFFAHLFVVEEHPLVVAVKAVTDIMTLVRELANVLNNRKQSVATV